MIEVNMKKRTVIITGGNEGIGLNIIKELLIKGHNVGVLDVSIANVEKLVESFPNQLIVFECDVTDYKRVNQCVNHIYERFSYIDYAIHNACIAIYKSILESTDSEYKSVFEVNFLGAVHLIQAVDPFMRKQNYGKIFLTSSGVGVMGFANLSPYACSKGAIETLAKSLNLEYQGSGITAHLIHPPLTNTKSAQSLPIPIEFKADPKKVGQGIANNLHKKKFIISHSFMQSIQNKFMYLTPIKLGKFMNMMTKKASSS